MGPCLASDILWSKDVRNADTLWICVVCELQSVTNFGF